MMWICYEVTDLDLSVAGKIEVKTLQHDKFYFSKNLILISSINSMHKNKISLLMVQISFNNISHLNLLKFKYLTIINFTYY